jgi:hypothetical protein
MTAVQIRVNGKLVATCGADALRQLVAMVAGRGLPGALAEPGAVYGAECAGMHPQESSTDEVLKWIGTRIAVGDAVSLKFVESSNGASADREDVSARPPFDG